ncbi:MAG: hypothetical protein WD512_05320, partial [Candidatus Paceibacterota bacterium]
FSLQEAIAYIIYDYRKSKGDWKEYYSSNFPDLPLVKDFVSASVYPGSKIPIVSWGDCPILPWKRSIINFLDSIESSDEINLNKQINFGGGDIKLHKDKTKEILTTEPLTLPTLLLPQASSSNYKEASISVKKFSSSIVVFKSRVRGVQYPNWHLYIIATPIHLTHNKDHDLGSFYWAANEKICIGEAPGRAAYCHNTVGIKGIMLGDNKDPYKCYGSEQAESLTDRQYGGELDVVREENDIFVVRVVAEDGVVYSNGSPLIKKYRRDFVILNSLEPVVFVITRGECEEAEEDIFVNFVCPNGAEAGLLSASNKYYTLANSNATLSLIGGNDTFLQVKPIEKFSGSCIIEDIPRRKHFCSIALLESGGQKSTTSLEKINGHITISCNAPGGEKYRINIPDTYSEIEATVEGCNNDF